MRKVGTPYKKGEGGRPKGVQNKITRTVRETFLHVFNKIQSDPKVNLEKFAKEYPRDFYQISSKLIPTDIKADITSAGEKLQPTIIIELPDAKSNKG